MVKDKKTIHATANTFVIDSKKQTLNGKGVTFGKVLFFASFYKNYIFPPIKQEEVFYGKFSGYLVTAITS